MYIFLKERMPKRIYSVVLWSVEIVFLQILCMFFCIWLFLFAGICPTDKMKAVSSLSDNLMEPKQRQVTVWVTKSRHQGIVWVKLISVNLYSCTFSPTDNKTMYVCLNTGLGPMNNGWTINVVLKSPASIGTSSKRQSPADRVVK